MGPNKFVHLMFVIGSLILAFLVSKTTGWVWSCFAKPEELVVTSAALLVGIGGGTWAYRNTTIRTAATEAVREIEKVAWPTRKETSMATVVVLVTVALAATVLSVFDAVWSPTVGWLLS